MLKALQRRGQLAYKKKTAIYIKTIISTYLNNLNNLNFLNKNGLFIFEKFFSDFCIEKYNKRFLFIFAKKVEIVEIVEIS